MLRRFSALRLGALFLATVLASFVFAAEKAATGLNVVLLLDESGSMRRTDPENARIDAAGLFLRLCRPSDRAEVVGFATNLRVLQELSAMGPGEERDRLLRLVKGIRSTGQWTDIEKALEQSLSELTRRGRDVPRAVLLMTDGKVDLGRGAQEDLFSIDRIRGALMARYVEGNVAVHCIAFSPQADFALLRHLAEATGGLCVRGDHPDDLQRLFVRLFEEIAQPQTAPLTDGQVQLDRSIREATFLITHSRDAKPSRLIRPDAKSFTARDFDRYVGVSWFSAPTYDLVTVARPVEGKWRVEPTPNEADSRVILLTDVELGVDRFEPTARSGEVKPLVASLRSEGKTIAAPEWIDAVSMRATLRTAADTSPLQMKDDGRHGDGSPRDGAFGTTLTAPSQAGAYDVELVARTPTLERRIIRSLSVVDRWFGVALQKELIAQGEAAVLTVVVENAPPLRPGQSRRFSAEVEGPGGLRRNVEARPLDAPGRYGIVFDDTAAEGDYRVTVVGEVRQGDASFLTDSVGLIDFRVSAPTRPVAVALPTVRPVEPSPTPAAPVEPLAAPEATPTPVPPPEPVAAKGTAWWGGPAAALAGLLVLVAVFAWIRLRRRRGPAASRIRASVAPREESAVVSATALLADAPTLIEPVAEEASPASRPKAPEKAPVEKTGSPVLAPSAKEEPKVPPAAAVSAREPEEEEAPPLPDHAPDGAEIIPEEEGSAEDEPKSEPLVAKQEPDAPLAEETGGEIESALALASPAAASEPSPALSDAEQALLAEILGGSGADAGLPSPSASSQSSTADEPPVPAKPPAGLAPQPAEKIEAETPFRSAAENVREDAGNGRAETAIPTIPDETDGRSDKQVIEDLLREIQRGGTDL